jgi:hypothetical protein
VDLKSIGLADVEKYSHRSRGSSSALRVYHDRPNFDFIIEGSLGLRLNGIDNSLTLSSSQVVLGLLYFSTEKALFESSNVTVGLRFFVPLIDDLICGADNVFFDSDCRLEPAFDVITTLIPAEGFFGTLLARWESSYQAKGVCLCICAPLTEICCWSLLRLFSSMTGVSKIRMFFYFF